MSFRPLGLSLSKPLFAHRHPLGPRHRPLGLRYRSSVLLSRASCSLREAASGCAPDRAVPFLCFAKEKEPKERRPPSPVGLGPTALRCSVFAARAELATRPAAAAFRQPPKVRGRRRCAPLQSPALLDGSEGPQEQCGRCFATFPVRADAKRGEWRRNRSMCAACLQHGVDRPNPCSHAAVTNQLVFGVFALVTFI